MSGSSERSRWFIPFAIGSGAIAILALYIPVAYGPRLELSTVIDLLIAGPAIWTVTVVVGLVIYRWRGLWLLLGAPLAFVDLIWFVATFSACDPTGTRCL